MGEEFVNRSVIGTRFGGRIVAETEVAGLPAVVPGDQRPRMDHGHGPVHARPRGPVPGGIRSLSSCDVAIVGAGIVGCATAYELARRGVSVHLIDRGEVSGGTTGLGEGNVLCCDKRPGPELGLAQLGLALYDEIEELLGAEAGIRRKGALVVHAGAELLGGGGRADRRAAGRRRRVQPARSGGGAGGRARAERRAARRVVVPARPPVRAARDRPRPGARGGGARREGRDGPGRRVDRASRAGA